MHDQRKGELPQMTDNEKTILKTKIEKFNQITTICLDKYRQDIFSHKLLDMTSILNEINPDNYTFWNYKKLLLFSLAYYKLYNSIDTIDYEAPLIRYKSNTELLHIYDKYPIKVNSKTCESIIDTVIQSDVYQELIIKELTFLVKVLMKQLKCYAAWAHRKYVLLHLSPIKRQIEYFKMENEHLDKLLTKDIRNFHAWGYRRFILGHLLKLTNSCSSSTNTQAEVNSMQLMNNSSILINANTEIKYTVAKLGDNFSNYSAWHARAIAWLKQYEILLYLPANITLSLATSILNSYNSINFSQIITKYIRTTKEQYSSLMCIINEEVQLLNKAIYIDIKNQAIFLYYEFIIVLLTILYVIYYNHMGHDVHSGIHPLDELRNYYTSILTCISEIKQFEIDSSHTNTIPDYMFNLLSLEVFVQCLHQKINSTKPVQIELDTISSLINVISGIQNKQYIIDYFSYLKLNHD